MAIMDITVGFPGSGTTHFTAQSCEQQHVVHRNAGAMRASMFPEPRYTADEEARVGNRGRDGDPRFKDSAVGILHQIRLAIEPPVTGEPAVSIDGTASYADQLAQLRSGLLTSG